MDARAKILGHPIHQMLIPLPLGVLSMAVIFDILALITDSPRLRQAVFYMIAAGVISGLVAAVFGLIDFLAIPKNTRAKRVGAMHGIGNVIVVVLFALSWLLRQNDPPAANTLATVVAVAGFALAGVTGWLGGELVDRLSVGVDDGAHLNAPSSLSGPVA